MSVDRIRVRSHVARDLLQSAALFKTEKLVVWEYVSNGLQYRASGIPPVVNVTLDTRKKQIVIDDNGAGMDREGLQRFFVMHGENRERKAGKPGRGRFGTGKSAAFGIADNLRVSTIREGRRNTVELSRTDIEAAGEDDIPVRTIERDVSTDEPNGTIVTISKVHLKKLDQRAIINYIERHLSHWPERPLVRVNNHVCEYTEPAVSETRKARPTGDKLELLGDVELTLKVAKSPLDPEMQGVAIHANGVWLDSTLAGADGQPMAAYIFGHIDVPSLDDESSPIPAFDMTRSMQLNRNNPVAEAVFAFVGYEVDRLRRELVSEEKARRAQEEAKKLDDEARKIAEMINRDFQEFSGRIAQVKARSGTGHDLGRVAASGSDEDSEQLVTGRELLNAVETGSQDAAGHDDGDSAGGGDIPNRGRTLTATDNGRLKGEPAGGKGKTPRQRGGFSVEFKELGEQSPRATYASPERTIYVNLEHPQILAAKGTGSVDDPVFRRLAYEVAFAEYAIALAQEMDKSGEFMEPSDALVDVRETLNRMARLAASLYAS